MWAKELRENGVLREVLSVMENNHPARFAVQPDDSGDLSPTCAALELGLTRGYSKYGDTLLLLAVRRQAHKDPGPSTYQPVPKEEKQNA